MTMDSRPLWLLVLLVGAALVQAQDDAEQAPAADDAAAADGAGADGEDECDCEEAWGYVQFLKEEINEKVTLMLTDDFKNPSDNIVPDTMEKVMDIRKTLLERIKNIRKGDEPTCKFQPEIEQEEKLSDFRMEIMEILLKLVEANANDNLREISEKLLEFRRKVNQEIMRLLMLSEPDCEKGGKPPTKETGDCEPFKSIAFDLENIMICASKSDDKEDEAEDGEDTGSAPDAAASDEDKKPGEDCSLEVAMYPMTLILANEKLDKAIEDLYNEIIEELDEQKRDELFAMLTMMKDLREEIDEVITKLLPLDEDAKIKKEVAKIGGLVRKVKAKLTNCNPCDSCAKDILEEAIGKMEEYLENFDSDRPDESKLEFVRGDVINFINKNTESARKLTMKKITEGKLGDCDSEKLASYNETKAPFWMLVNFTIFQQLPEVTEMIKTMEQQLKMKLSDACDSTTTTPRPQTDNSCDWDEYNQNKDVLEEVDNQIQENIFKGEDKSKVLLGFLTLQEMFDKRVKTLFEDGVQCPEELMNIKTVYMPIMSDCMTEFMDPKLEFEKLRRSERLGCIKGLRNTMENQNADLLQRELDKSLNEIGSGRKGRNLVISRLLKE